MDSTQYQENFSAFGKAIKISNSLDTFINNMKTQVEDIAVELSSNYNEIANPLNIAISNINNIINSSNNYKNISKNIIDSYLLNVTKGLLNSSASSISVILDEMIEDMVNNNESVLISGTFYNYFESAYNKQLNAVSTGETISDSLVI